MSGRAYSVYFIRQVGTLGPVKIGCSSYTPDRLYQLSVWSPVQLEVAASFVGNYSDERRLHGVFVKDHSHHEWFRWSPRLEEIILDVRAGTFDIESLPALRALPRVQRDNGYLTPEWGPRRGIETRLRNMKRKGLSDQAVQESGIDDIPLDKLTGAEFVAARVHAETILAKLAALVPIRPAAVKQIAA